jgi:hypothetical protein
MRQTMKLCDIVRIDHFRGFESFWEIPAESATAVDGQWRPGPGKDVFTAMRRELGDAQGRLRIIAEDLGIITPEVDALRQAIGLPGMRILQFAFRRRRQEPLSAAQLRRQYRRLYGHPRQRHEPWLVGVAWPPGAGVCALLPGCWRRGRRRGALAPDPLGLFVGGIALRHPDAGCARPRFGSSHERAEP